MSSRTEGINTTVFREHVPRKSINLQPRFVSSRTESVKETVVRVDTYHGKKSFINKWG